MRRCCQIPTLWLVELRTGHTAGLAGGKIIKVESPSKEMGVSERETRLKQTLEWGEKALEAFIVAALAVMVVLVFGNVVLRYGFNSGIAVSEELSRFLFVWMTFIGTIVAARRGEHICTDFLRVYLSGVSRRVLDLLSELTIAFCCGLLIDGGWRLTVLNHENISTIIKVPLSVFYLSGVLTGIFILCMTLARLWLLLVNRGAEADVLNAHPTGTIHVD